VFEIRGDMHQGDSLPLGTIDPAAQVQHRFVSDRTRTICFYRPRGSASSDY
jgi:hypothetical protein